MQFIANGPDIPEDLLQAQEEGRVVFFCGAGISYPAGLPGFKGLVEQIYRLNGTALSDIEREAFEREQFDATLDLLERRLPGQRLAVRRTLAQALKPKLRRKGLSIRSRRCCVWLAAARARYGWSPPTSTASFTWRPNAPGKRSRTTQLRCCRFQRTAAGTGWSIYMACYLKSWTTQP